MNSVEDTPYRILHIADPHFSNCHFVGSPVDSGTKHADEVIELLLAHNKLSRKFDVMVLSGDFTFRCDSTGFDAAAAFIQRLAPYVADNGILVIPGNHDIDQGNPAKISNLWLPTPKDQSEREYRRFLQQINQYVRAPNPSLSMIAKCSRQTGPSLFVVGLNSCRVERRDAQGWGYVGMDQISQSAYAVLDHGAKDDDIVIGVTHHNLLPIWDLGLEVLGSAPGRRKYSFTMDAGGVLGFVADLGVSVLLHGHTHVQSVKRVEGYGSNQPTQQAATLVLGAGTLGLTAGRNDEPRHFQMIEIDSAELRLWDFTCFYHTPNSPRVWNVSKMYRALLASWKIGHAHNVLKSRTQQSYTCAYDVEVMNSWSVLHAWGTSAKQNQAIVSDLTAKLTGQNGTKAIGNCLTQQVLESIIEEIVSQPPDEHAMTNFTLEQSIIFRISKKKQSWLVLPPNSKPSLLTLKQLAADIFADVHQLEPTASSARIESALRKIVQAYPSDSERCRSSLAQYVARLAKSAPQ